MFARNFTLTIFIFLYVICLKTVAIDARALRRLNDHDHEDHEEYVYEEEYEEEEEIEEVEGEGEYSFEVDCSSDNEEILFAQLHFTPCVELVEEIIGCESGCTLENFQSDTCIAYAMAFPERIYECIPKAEESLLQLPTIHFNPFMRFFSLAIDSCIESASGMTLNEILGNTLESSARYFGEYVPPTIMEKTLYAQLGEDLWKKNWQQVYITAKQLGIRPCRLEHNNYDIFMFLPPENAARYSGPVMAFRVDSPASIILHASRLNLRLDNLNYMMEIFANSDVQALVFQPYSPLSSLEKDLCQLDSRITEGTHSMETPIFHLLMGLADAFPVSVFVESQECNRCVGVIGRGMSSGEAEEDSLIMNFINDANDIFNPLRDRADHAKTWHVDLDESFLEDNIFLPSTVSLNGYRSTGSVLGRYLNKVANICDVENYPVEKDMNRYLSLQREARSLQSIESQLSWEGLVKLLDKLADGEFMENRLAEHGRNQNGEDGGYPSPNFLN